MDAFWRRKYRQDAAAWAAEGRLAMSIRPSHLLELLQDFRPAPSPTELEQRIDAMRIEVLDLRRKLASESERANRAYAEGHAAGVLENIETVRKLRAQIGTRTAKAQTPA